MIESYLSDDWDKEAASIDLVAETTQPRGTEEELSKVKDAWYLYNKLFYIRCQQKR